MSAPTHTSVRENTETYRAPAEAGAPRLTGIRGATTVEDAAPRVVELERYDTADLRLATSGIVLAIHRTDERAVWRLDLPDAVDGERLERPAPGVDPDLPAELLDVVHGVLRGAPVGPVGRIRRVRHEQVLRDGRRRETATLTRDEVQLATFGAAARLENWTETAVRLTLVAPAGLGGALADALGETGATPTGGDAEAELDRLLREAAAPRPERATLRRKHPGGPVLAYVARHVDVLAAEDIRARRDEYDAVHQLRVSARRIRSALQAYRPILDPVRTGGLVAELRWLGQVLAPSRDLEVLEERIGREIAGLPPELVLGPVRAQVTRHFARSRAEARAAMLEALDGARYAALRGALERFLQDPPVANPRARGGLAALERKARRRFDRRLRAARSGEGIHDARKAAKRLRYALEVTGGKTGRLKRVQKQLGAHQDAVVALGALRDLGARAHAEGENGFTFGLLHGRISAEAARISAAL
ncbi:CYTH and CHAD domain-containing protein [Pseudonocardia ailaonensis]|uniref:CYTH and CHAD domain-containing protein n=1 Tax=Pseudonocardia ailaonensis TaxID=367279 RepID=A0ABN2NBS0_9PSEU